MPSGRSQLRAVSKILQRLGVRQRLEVFRLAAVHDRFAVPAATAAQLPGLAGPVLLVDDLADSRWTMTVAGALLRRAGAPGVLPFALASAG